MAASLLLPIYADGDGFRPLKETEYRDPWRVVNGVTNYIPRARLGRWRRFAGEVLQVTEGGVRLMGYCEGVSLNVAHNVEFLVAGFPYEKAENEFVSIADNCTAQEAGVFTYTTVLGATRTIRKLEYGRVIRKSSP